MGLAYANLLLKNPAREDAGVEVKALADTGAVTLCIPQDTADALGLSPNGEIRELSLADGGRIQAPYVGPIEVWFKGRHCYVGATILGDEVLLGAIPMEDMDLVVTPATQDVTVNPDSPSIPSLKTK